MTLPRTIWIDPTDHALILRPEDRVDGDVEYRRPTVVPLVLCAALIVLGLLLAWGW